MKDTELNEMEEMRLRYVLEMEEMRPMYVLVKATRKETNGSQ